MQHIRLSTFMIPVIILWLSSLEEAQILPNVENIFQQNVNITPGDVIQCEITKINTQEIKNQDHIYTLPASNLAAYQLRPITGKCLSFQVRANHSAHIILSSTTYIENKLEVIIDKIGGQLSAIRETTSAGEVYLHTLFKVGLINIREFRGFWIRWLDNELLEVGLESEQIPFLYYRFTKKLEIKFFGVMTWAIKGAWLIDLEPKCPGAKVLKTSAQSDCFLLK